MPKRIKRARGMLSFFRAGSKCSLFSSSWDFKSIRFFLFFIVFIEVEWEPVDQKSLKKWALSLASLLLSRRENSLSTSKLEKPKTLSSSNPATSSKILSSKSQNKKDFPCWRFRKPFKKSKSNHQALLTKLPLLKENQKKAS